MRKTILALVATAIVVQLTLLPARAANQVSINWYVVNPTFADFDYAACGSYNCSQIYTNADPEVGPLLLNGLPVVSSANPAGLVEEAGTAIQWWTPSAGVAFQGTTIQTLPIYQTAFASEGQGNNDSNSFQTATFSATLHVGGAGGAITFGGDDDMFLALNGEIVDEVGGVHPPGPLQTYDVSAGTYAMKVFYADRHVVDAFAELPLRGAVTTSVTEFSAWAMVCSVLRV